MICLGRMWNTKGLLRTCHTTCYISPTTTQSVARSIHLPLPIALYVYLYKYALNPRPQSLPSPEPPLEKILVMFSIPSSGNNCLDFCAHHYVIALHHDTQIHDPYLLSPDGNNYHASDFATSDMSLLINHSGNLVLLYQPQDKVQAHSQLFLALAKSYIWILQGLGWGHKPSSNYYFE